MPHVVREIYFEYRRTHLSLFIYVPLFFLVVVLARVLVEAMNAVMSSSAESDAELLIHMNNVYLRSSFTSPFSPSYYSAESSS
jgi:hypothetical protein